MDSLDSESALEKQIENHVERTGSLIAGEFEEASAQGMVKYAYSVHRAVEHLESLCAPITDDQYIDDAPSSASNVDDKLKNGRYNKVMRDADKKFRYLTRMLYRRGIL